MFGKVTKGFFGSEQGADHTSLEVETLLGRVADGVVVEDRREALAILSELLHNSIQAQQIIGMNGLSVLCGVLRDEKGDKEMLRGALECLSVALTPSPAGNLQSPGAMNAELFVRGKENIALLLGPLLQDENDFYVRYHTVQILTALAAGGSHRLPEAVLAAPTGVVKLMDLLGDSHEVVRNEALLLLIGLAHASPEVKRIAAFEGAFGRLLAIIEEEGGTDGGIVVQDCFELLNTLLRGNAGNQLLFRETGHLQQLLQMLKLPESQFSRSLPRQRASNIRSLLDTFIFLLVQPPANANGHAPQGPEPQRLHNAAALLKGGLLDKLLMLALKGSEPSAQSVRNQALLCLAHLISHFPAGQEQLVMSGLGWLRGTPALRQVLRICLHTREPPEHSAARSVIRAFCRGNAEGQGMLAATLVPVADQDPGNTTFGGEIVKALSQPDVTVSSRAAAVVTCMIDDNPAVKQRLQSIPLELSPAPGAPPTLLMPQCISHLSNAIYAPGKDDRYAAAVLLRLLITWVSECQPAAQAFLGMPANLPFVVDVVTGRKGGSSAIVSGLAALLLGVCLVAEQADGSSSAALDSITTKVGLQAFFEVLDGLFSDAQFQAAASGPRAPRPALRTPPSVPQEEEPEEGAPPGANGAAVQQTAENPFDYAFAQWALDFKPQIRQHLISGASGADTRPREPPGSRLQAAQGMTEAQQLQEATTVIEKLERELESLKARNRALTQQALDLQRPAMLQDDARGPGQAVVPSFSSPVLQEQPTRDAELLRDAERRAAEAEAQCSSLKEECQALRGHSAEVDQRQRELEADLREARQDAEEAQAAASKYESDLEALSSAYTDLESHAHQLEGQLRASEGTSSAAGAPPVEGDEGDAMDDQLSDLLVCLGQEEQKVERLQQKLKELGIDPEPLLVDLGEDEEDGEETNFT